MISALLAMDEKGGIGFDNGLPWPKNREDMDWFRSRTQGTIVVMGRKTWESLGEYAPLPNRLNVVVTSKPLSSVPGAIGTLYGDNLCTAIKPFETGYDGREIIVMGGAEIYHQLFPVCQKIYITKIKGTYPADTFLDMTDVLSDFMLEHVDEKQTCNIEKYIRIK